MRGSKQLKNERDTGNEKNLIGLAGAALVGLLAAPAMANHSGGLPADRVVLAAAATILVDTNLADDLATGMTLFGPLSYKMSTSEDMIVSVHMECKIVTTTKVKGKANGGAQDLVDSERGFARVWIEVASHDDPDNFLVLNADVFPADTTDPLCDGLTLSETACLAINAGAVTMCDRAQVLELTNPDELNFDLELTLATLQAHGFTWWREFGEDGR